MFNPTFQYYSGQIKDSKPKGIVLLDAFVGCIQRPKQKTLSLINEIRSTKDKATKDGLKTKLPAFTPCIVIKNGGMRRYSDIVKFTGILMLDFDKLNSFDMANDFRNELFENYKYIIASWLSSSGKGVRAMVRVPESKNVDEYKARFESISDEMKQFNGFDTAPKNAVLPLFYSYDKDIRYNNKAEIFRGLKYPKVEPMLKNTSWIMPDGKYKRWAFTNIQKAIDKINDNGHPQLRAASFCLGGYVASGYIDEGEAIHFIDSEIDSNTYLRQKAQIYKKTARQMIKKGYSKPVRFNK